MAIPPGKPTTVKPELRSAYKPPRLATSINELVSITPPDGHPE